MQTKHKHNDESGKYNPTAETNKPEPAFELKRDRVCGGPLGRCARSVVCFIIATTILSAIGILIALCLWAATTQTNFVILSQVITKTGFLVRQLALQHTKQLEYQVKQGAAMLDEAADVQVALQEHLNATSTLLSISKMYFLSATNGSNPTTLLSVYKDATTNTLDSVTTSVGASHVSADLYDSITTTGASCHAGTACWGAPILLNPTSNNYGACGANDDCKPAVPVTVHQNDKKRFVATVIDALTWRTLLKTLSDDTAISIIIVDRKTQVVLAATENFGNPSTNTKLPTMADYENKVIRAIGETTKSIIPGVAASGYGKTRVFVSGYTAPWWVNMFPIITDDGADLVLMSIDNYTEVSEILVYAALAVTGVTMLFFFCTGGVQAFLIVHPLRLLWRQMLLVEDMKLDDVLRKKTFSLFSEIAGIQRQFYLMVLKLVEYRAFLPENLLSDDGAISKQNESGRVGKSSGRHKGSTVMPHDSSSSDHSPSLRRDSVSSSSSTEARGGNRSKFSIGVEIRNVSVLVIKIRNFWPLLEQSSSDDVIQKHSKLLEEVIRVIKQTRGDLALFDETTIMVTWNAITRNSHHALKACEAAVLVRDLVRKMNGVSGNELGQAATPGSYDRFFVSMGIATGSAYCGNIGTATRRQYRTFGVTEAVAKVLERLNKEWNTGILCNQETHNAVNKTFLTREIEEVNIPSLNRKASVFELVDKSTFNEEEWLYEVASKELAGKIAIFRDAYQLYNQAKFTDAKKRFEEFLTACQQRDESSGNKHLVYAQDKLSSTMMSLCSAASQSGLTTSPSNGHTFHANVFSSDFEKYLKPNK